MRLAWFRATVLTLALIGGGLSPLAAQVPAEKDPQGNESGGDESEAYLRVAARIGFADRSRYVKVNRWNPITVELENRATRKDQGVKGWIRVWHDVPVERADDTSSLVPVELPPMSKKLLVLPEMVEEDDNEVRVELLVGGQVVAADGVLLTDLTRVGELCDLVLTISPRSAALGWLESRPIRPTDPFEYPARFVLPVRPRDLPEQWITWEGADILLIDDPEELSLGSEQVEALRTFVRLGGTLVVGTGRNAAVLAESALEPLLPAALGPEHMWVRTSAGPGPEQDLTAAVEAATGTRESQVADAPGVRLLPRRGRVSASAGAFPLVVEESMGLGRIVQFAFAVSEPVLVRSEAIRAFVRARMGTATRRILREPYEKFEGTTYSSPDPGIDPSSWLPGAQEGGRFTSFGPGGFARLVRPPGWRDVVESSLLEDLLTRIPPWRVVFLFALTYFLAMIPGCFLLFRAVDRLEWAWPAMVLVSLAFSGIAYAHGLRGGASTLMLKHVSLVHAGSGSPEGRAIDLIGLASAGHVRGDFGFDAAERYVTRLRTREDKRGLEREKVVRSYKPEGPVLQDFRVLARSIRGVEILRRESLGEGVQVRIERGAGQYDVRVFNGTDQELREPLLVLGGGAFPVPGGSIPALGERSVVVQDHQLVKLDFALTTWIQTLNLSEELGGQSRNALLGIGKNEMVGPLSLSLLAALEAPGFSMTFDNKPLPAYGVTLLAVRAEAVLARGEFTLAPGDWRLRAEASGHRGFQWSPSEGEVEALCEEATFVLKPLFWSPDAQVASGSCSIRVRPTIGEGAPVTAVLLPWRLGKASGPGLSVDPSGRHPIPLDRGLIDPHSGSIRVRAGSETGFHLLLRMITLEGKRP